MRITPKMQELVDKITADMESGKPLPWETPWFYSAMRNWKTGRPYRGINPLSLALNMERAHATSGQFLTFKQASDAQKKVKNGEHGTPVYFFQPLRVKDKETGEEKDIPLMKTYIVFAVEQCEGIDPKPDEHRGLNPNKDGDLIIQKSGAKIIENCAGTFSPAYYRLSTDSISVPKRNLWKSDEKYYSTLFHELTHWTQTPERANRPHKYEGEGRAFEELVAEMGAAFLCARVGFKYETNHASYVSSWVQMLKDHKEALYLAASKAQKACDYLLKQAGMIEAKKEAVAA